MFHLRARTAQAWRRLWRLRSMRANQRGLVVSAWSRLLLVDALVRIQGVQRTARQAPTVTMTLPTAAQVDFARECSYWLRVAARHHVIRAECLHMSLALHRWLRAAGVPSALDIGVRLDRGTLRAHAWVHVGEHLVSDRPIDIVPFTPLVAKGGLAWL